MARGLSVSVFRVTRAPLRIVNAREGWCPGSVKARKKRSAGGGSAERSSHRASVALPDRAIGLAQVAAVRGSASVHPSDASMRRGRAQASRRSDEPRFHSHHLRPAGGHICSGYQGRPETLPSRVADRGEIRCCGPGCVRRVPGASESRRGSPPSSGSDREAPADYPPRAPPRRTSARRAPSGAWEG